MCACVMDLGGVGVDQFAIFNEVLVVLLAQLGGAELSLGALVD